MVETTIKPQEYTPDPSVNSALEGALSTMPEGLRGPYKETFEAQRKNQFDILEKERVQKANLAQQKATAAGGLATGMQRQYDQFNKMEAPPKFNVAPETREGLIGMASLLPIAGLILGAGGMNSGVNAMKALTGIINGHAEGNKERIAFEKTKYEAAMKDWDANYKLSRQKLTDALEMMKTNYQAGLAKAEAAAVAMGPETAAILRKEGLTSLIGKIDEAAKRTQQHQDKIEELTGRRTSGGSNISDDTATFLARRFIEGGDRSAMQGLGSGAIGAANRAKVNDMIRAEAEARGMTPAAISAKQAEFEGLRSAQRTLGSQSARVGSAAKEAYALVEPALEASRNVPRGKFVPLNSLMQTAKQNISDPNLIRFKEANNALVNTYVRAIVPTGVGTDLVRRHAYDLLRTVDGPEAYKAAVDQLKIEMNAAIGSPALFASELAAKWAGLPDAPAAMRTEIPDVPIAAPSTTPQTTTPRIRIDVNGDIIQ